MWIQTGVTVRKRLRWVLSYVTLTFDLWPWPFGWTSLLSLVITPENFMMIQWCERSQKGVTDGQTDRQTDWTIHRAAWSQLKMVLHKMKYSIISWSEQECETIVYVSVKLANLTTFDVFWYSFHRGAVAFGFCFGFFCFLFFVCLLLLFCLFVCFCFFFGGGLFVYVNGICVLTPRERCDDSFF